YPVPVAWRYRNYVIDAFNADKPYDEFLREQIAGDILARQGPRERYAERVTATGYLAISRRFGFDSENYHHLTIQDTLDNLGQTVLGLTLGCARCHAHKYDPVSMPDYYALYGIFDSTRYAFPGSEQKQRHRSMVPLLPPEESEPRWRTFETRVARLAATVEAQKKSVPSAILRSLDDMDGDLEMQAPAAGGSKGVLVPPWVYSGPIAVTADAQSPFKNLHARGKVGASVSAGTNGYSIAQTLHPRRTRDRRDVVHVNLDFRLAKPSSASPEPGVHVFAVGSPNRPPAVEVVLSTEGATLRCGERTRPIRSLASDTWYDLQLTLDLGAGTVGGSLGRPGDVAEIASFPLDAATSASVNELRLASSAPPGAAIPGIAFDNLGFERAPIPPVSTTPPESQPDSPRVDFAGLSEAWKEFAGIDGDFELQEADRPPASPWGPGPNSVVAVRAGSQSPFRNLYPAGRLGIGLPQGSAYNGFGQTLPTRRDANQARHLFVAFDFRVGDAPAGGSGSWRYYLGHGPRPSPAIELFFTADQAYRRSGDRRDPFRALKPGEWYQVQITLDLERKEYAGSIASASDRTEFSGRTATGWDGTIDYTFVDSYGHLGGPKPAFDADNFVIRTTPLPSLDTPALAGSASENDARRERAQELRRQLAEAAAAADRAKQELEALLADGPTELVYGVSEGTPRDARIQIRGEPDRPGDEVPRGFLPILGGKPLPNGTEGSGRLELARWLTEPSNPLTARVMVNRIWQYHFGQALVRTPNDFGTRGQRPIDPDLLDHLATQFVRSGWSIKAMHRLIMNSAVYRQQSRQSAAPAGSPSVPLPADCPIEPTRPEPAGDREGPPDFARSPQGSDAGQFTPFVRRRLTAEELRDAILATGGGLDPSPGRGHPFPAPTAWGYTQHGPYAATYDHHRRSVYLMTQRLKRHPYLALFDGADPNSGTAERRTSTVPTQALFFLNDPFVHAQAESFARRILAVPGDDVTRIVSAYRLAFGRPPHPAEIREAERFLAEYRAEAESSGDPDPRLATHAAFARVLFAGNEFLTVD
ncbi:MAG: DUF1553 domain-containing protein, partial [Verrucomicrobiales bacterium]|nr:DUF1553 domain-containing protein [Verrucomicrobiales bacterium]